MKVNSLLCGFVLYKNPWKPAQLKWNPRKVLKLISLFRETMCSFNSTVTSTEVRKNRFTISQRRTKRRDCTTMVWLKYKGITWMHYCNFIATLLLHYNAICGKSD